MADLLDAKEQQFVAELLAGRTARNAAAKVGMPERTAYRKLSEGPVADFLAEVGRATMAAAHAWKLGKVHELQETRWAMIHDPATPAAVRRNLIRDEFDDLERFGVVPDLAGELGELRELVDRALGRAA